MVFSPTSKALTDKGKVINHVTGWLKSLRIYPQERFRIPFPEWPKSNCNMHSISKENGRDDIRVVRQHTASILC